jgi:hypothetical protein
VKQLQTVNNQSLTIDIRKRAISSTFVEKSSMNHPIPQFVQGDTNIIEAVIKDNGEDADLSVVGKVVGNFKRQDNVVVSRSAVVSGNVVTYTLGNEEMIKAGIGELELQFFNTDESERLSTLRFKVNVTPEIGFGLEGTDGPTLAQELIVNGQYAEEQANIAKQSAEEAIAAKESSITTWLSPVADYTAVTSIASPQHGDTVQTNDTGYVYRYENGSWKNTQQYGATSLANVNARLADIAINVKTYGAVGDGVTDDTASLQSAFNAANNRTLHLNDDDVYLVTSRITMPSNINITGNGKFILTGDEDYWFYANTPQKIIWENFTAEITNDINSRAKLNRALRCDYPVYLEVKKAFVTKATTALHCFFGEDFVCGDIYLYDTQGWEGTDGREGYGLASSAKRFSVDKVYWKNSDATFGRHPIYVNGNSWEKVLIKSVYVENCKIFPISIIHSGTVKAVASIDHATFINCNLGSSVASNGCIQGGDENGSNVTVHIGNVEVDITGGSAVSFQGNEDYLSIGNVKVKNLPVATYANSHVVNIRNGRIVRIGSVDVEQLNTNWISAVYLRDIVNASVNKLNVGGTLGEQALRNSGSNVEVGTVESTITKTYRSGGSFNHTSPLNKVFYSGAAPTTGAYKKGDIVYLNSPVAGGYIGYICIADGTPGTWKGFGLIQS